MYEKHFANTRAPKPVHEPIPGKAMVKNTDGGGFVFEVDDFTRLERFLILGAEGGSYYQGEKELTVENGQAAVRLLQTFETGSAALELVHNVSIDGRAPKNDPALFVLALATISPDVDVRRKAWLLLPDVARTGTHILTFAKYRDAMGGWGKLARKHIGNWYLGKAAEDVAFQALKYPQRDGWSHADLLRLSHAHATGEGSKVMNAVFSAITHPEAADLTMKRQGGKTETRKALGTKKLVAQERLPEMYEGVLKARAAKTAEAVAKLVTKFRLQREMVPTEWHDDPVVYEALFEHMPMTAMIRNLGNMSKIGFLKPLSATVREVCTRLTDEDRLKRARVHPLSLLMASRVYAGGKGRRGKGEWTVVPQVVDALDEAIEKSFRYAPMTDKRWVLGVDVSSSMDSNVCGDTGITAREAAALMALVIARREPQYFIGGFSHEFVDLGLTANDSFAIAREKVDRAYGATRTELPITHALKNGIEADVFMILTDNEVNQGVHPVQRLKEYRKQTGINAKMIVCAFTATRFSIADPNDAGMLDVAGLDASVPAIVADFAAH